MNPERIYIAGSMMVFSLFWVLTAINPADFSAFFVLLTGCVILIAYINMKSSEETAENQQLEDLNNIGRMVFNVEQRRRAE